MVSRIGWQRYELSVEVGYRCAICAGSSAGRAEVAGDLVGGGECEDVRVEQLVVGGAEQQAVGGGHALAGRSLAPWNDVCGLQRCPDGEPTEGAFAVVCREQGSPEDVLGDAPASDQGIDGG